MTAEAAEPDAYRCERLREALARDPRVSSLDLEVRLIGNGEVLVSGEVATPQRRRAVAEVVAEELPGLRLHNEVVVTPVAGTAGVEELP
jgi:osmotically-inducible protein OsmY